LELNVLLKGCRKNNRQAQEALYKQYKNMLFVQCLKYCPNDSEAEDVLHDTFIEIFTSIHTFKGSGSFEGWIKRIAINKSINQYKKKYALVAIKDDFEQEITLDESELSYSLETLMKLVQDLPPQYRLVFSLYELDSYSHKEIASLLSISESTSKSNLHRAKLILKEKLKDKNKFPKNYVKNG